MSFRADYLSIGSKIDIIKSNDKSVTYPSQILDILESNEMIISGPIKQSNLVLLHKNEKIYISYNVENKGKYLFTAKILARNLSSIYTLTIERISEIKKIQLRDHYRLLTRLKVEKEHLITQGDNVEKFYEHCETKDISGGGMKLNCNYKHKEGEEIVCSFNVNGESIKVKARVIRVEELNSFNYKYSIGIKFLEIESEMRDEIIKYIFEQQRILRLKGLI